MEIIHNMTQIINKQGFFEGPPKERTWGHAGHVLILLITYQFVILREEKKEILTIKRTQLYPAMNMARNIEHNK